MLSCGLRCDGRLTGELRPISCETNIFDKLHGSSLFRRGETEVKHLIKDVRLFVLSRCSLLLPWMCQIKQPTLMSLLQLLGEQWTIVT